MPFTLRDAAVRDAAALASLHVRAFQETHGGGPGVAARQAQWEAILARGDGRDFTLLIEDADGAPVAFGRGRPHDGGVPGFEGELNKIYVLRGHQRRGLGRLLVCRIADRFLSQGTTSMLLFGDAGSPSNGFYEHLGAERLFGAGGQFHGGYGWRDIRDLGHRCADADVTRRRPSRESA